MLLKRSGDYWYRAGTSQAVNKSLSNNTTANIVPIGSTQNGVDCHSVFTNWENPTGSNKRVGTCKKAGNGLWYGPCSSSNVVGSQMWSYCSNRGMRPAERAETNYTNYSKGVPSCGWWTWTQTESSYGGTERWIENTHLGRSGLNESFLLRCVK